uniref:Uncharacterized protein n=1 Tax=Anguilla anguilla TaxID=7936 RepID=A0A0E9WP29_ANGAN
MDWICKEILIFAIYLSTSAQLAQISTTNVHKGLDGRCRPQAVSVQPVFLTSTPSLSSAKSISAYSSSDLLQEQSNPLMLFILGVF